jgi:hypothetical protein
MIIFCYSVFNSAGVLICFGGEEVIDDYNSPFSL